MLHNGESLLHLFMPINHLWDWLHLSSRICIQPTFTATSTHPTIVHSFIHPFIKLHITTALLYSSLLDPIVRSITTHSKGRNRHQPKHRHTLQRLVLTTSFSFAHLNPR